jgi:hypothetical protein
MDVGEAVGFVGCAHHRELDDVLNARRLRGFDDADFQAGLIDQVRAEQEQHVTAS